MVGMIIFHCFCWNYDRLSEIYQQRQNTRNTLSQVILFNLLLFGGYHSAFKINATYQTHFIQLIVFYLDLFLWD